MMNKERMLDRFFARDASCNSRFIAAVTTTGVYCVASCGARRPEPGHIRFFRSPDEARSGGFRPCRRCHPDEAFAGKDPDYVLVTALAGQIRTNPERFPSASDLTRHAGLGSTRLNELFRLHYHRPPGDYLSEARVKRTKTLLLETDDPVGDIAFAAGFGSLSAFNHAFLHHTGLSPVKYRHIRENPAFSLVVNGSAPYPDPAYTTGLLRFQARDRESPTEKMTGNALYKAVLIDGSPCILGLEADGPRVHVRLETGGPLSPMGCMAMHDMAQRMLGCHPDPGPFETMAQRNPQLKQLIEKNPGLRIQQTATIFESLVWAIIGQQVNMPFAFQMRRELLRKTGLPAGGDLIAHPTAEAIASLDYGDLLKYKFSHRKAEYLIDTARLATSGQLPVDSADTWPYTELVQRLLAVRGIGVWTVNYLAMRGCGFSDCVPVGDSGLRAGLKHFFQRGEAPDAEETLRLMNIFRPYRSFGTFHLWRLAGGIT